MSVNIPFEHLADVLVGKLLEAGLVCECSIGVDSNSALGMFVAAAGTLEPLDRRFAGFVDTIARASAEFFAGYPALAQLIVEAEGDAQPECQEYRYGERRTIRLEAQAIRTQTWKALLGNVVSSGTFTGEFPETGGSWLSMQRGPKPERDDLKSTPRGYRWVPHMNRLPWVQVGRLRARGLDIEEAYIYHDSDNVLTLYFSFPIGPLDEFDKDKETSDVLKIVDCSVQAFTHYPELLRLAIWTRPDLEDKVGIPTFWLARDNVLKYSSGELSAHNLLASAKNYTSE